MSTIVAPPPAGSNLDRLEEAFALDSPTPDIQVAFTKALRALAAGESVRVEPVPAILTTGQAADLLDISRTTMVTLLDEGAIPCEKPHVHRHVRLADVLAYKERRSTERRAMLAQMREQSLDDGTDDITLDEAAAAVDHIRHHRA